MTPTAATGFKKSLPVTLAGIRKDLTTARERLLEQLAAVDADLVWVGGMESAASIGERVLAFRVIEMAIADDEEQAA